MRKFLTLAFCLCAMNCSAKEFEVTHKEFAQISMNKLKREGHKILEIVPLDTDKNGYVTIAYE